MKNRLIPFVFVFIASLFLGCPKKDQTSKAPPSLDEQVNSISLELFTVMVKYFQAKMNSTDPNISKEEYRLMAMASNTVSINSLGQKDSILSEFDTEFNDKYLLKCVAALDAGLSFGMGFYSKEYNLYIGGGGCLKDGSHFSISSASH